MSESSTANIDVLGELKSGVAHHQSGNLDRAEQHYYNILAVNPHHADALHLLGLVAHQRGNPERAIEYIEKAISNNYDCSFYHNNLGAVLKDVGDLNKAIDSYQKAIQLRPDYAEAAYNLGSLLLVKGKISDAIVWYEKAIRIRPDYVDALSNLAAAYNTLKRTDDAILCCEKVLSLNPNNAAALNNLGNALRTQKKTNLAIACYQKSISADRVNPEAHCNLGNAYHDLGDQEKALASYRQALMLNLKYGKAYNNMGIVLREQGRLAEAADCYRKAIQLLPEDAEAYHNFGNILKDQGLLDKAVDMYQRAIVNNASSIDTHVNLGIVLEDLGKTEDAIRSYSNALKIDPNSAKAYSHLVHQLLDVCAWHQLDPLNEKLDVLTEHTLKNGEKPDEMPFLNLSRNADPSLNYNVARAWSREIERQFSGAQPFYPTGKHTPHDSKKEIQPIIIGYLSNNFKNHPTAHLVQGMFQHHDRKRFAAYCYSYGRDDKSSYRKKIMATCDRFVDISRSSHMEAAKQIYDDGVDILVDLVGYMKDNRLGIPAMRPAPIQVRWLGMAGTTGADFFDYLIADEIVAPPEHSSFYSEALVYLPHCYQINDNTQIFAEGGITRGDVGLPNEGIVFCSFCSRYKYDPVMFRTWMRILKQVKGSVLWLLGGNANAEKNLKQYAESSGIRPDRLIFAKKIPRDEHLQRLQLADIALDTRIVNGAITTSEALWAGVPLVTLQGNHFASRMSSSILSAAELHSLITTNLDDYEVLAVRLANQPNTLNELRKQMRLNRMCIPLFDTERFVRNIESAYLNMVEIYDSGKTPRPIRVPVISTLYDQKSECGG